MTELDLSAEVLNHVLLCFFSSTILCRYYVYEILATNVPLLAYSYATVHFQRR
jgi:hypothetical protein